MQVNKLKEAAFRANPREVIEAYKVIVPTFSPNRDMIYNEKKKQPFEKDSTPAAGTKLRVVN